MPTLYLPSAPVLLEGLKTSLETRATSSEALRDDPNVGQVLADEALAMRAAMQVVSPDTVTFVVDSEDITGGGVVEVWYKFQDGTQREGGFAVAAAQVASLLQH